MKKYLMSLAAFALAGGFMVSCSNKDDIVNVNDLTPAEKYKIAFEAAFGKVNKTDANRTWGFEDQTRLVFDANGKLVTRSDDANGNQWATYVRVPDKLTEAQMNKVRDYFQTHKSPEGIAVNWSDFFVQQVYKGGTRPTDDCPEVYHDGYNQEVVGGEHMDYLTCGLPGEHIYNFNDGEGAPYGNVAYALGPNYNPVNNQNDLLYHTDRIEFMINSSTEAFGYYSSYSSEQRNNNYRIIPGDVIQEWNSEGGSDADVSGMFFVGFDFECTGANPNQQVAADNYYSDWIVKITPGLYRKGQRVFVEDLIAGIDDLSKLSISDWDFNDAVFDVHFDNVDGTDYAVIVLYAAGGTLPLTVGGKEVHEMFGVNVNQMVNTGAGPECPVAIFRVATSVKNANEIPVYVNGDILLEALDKNPDTQKIAAPAYDNIPWVGERVFINDVYKFKEWLEGTVDNWYEKR